MKIPVRKTGKKAGAPPGTIMHLGEHKTYRVKITRVNYDENNYSEKEDISVDELFTPHPGFNVEWVNFDGIHDVEMVERIGSHYGINMLVLEDIVNSSQRPKFEDYDDYVYIVLRMLKYDEAKNETESEQVSIILNHDKVLTFQEKESDDFESIRERIRKKKGKLHRSGPDFLCYSIIDFIIDNYFIVLEKIGDRIDILEEEVLGDTEEQTIQKLHSLKRDTLAIRKSLWPIRDILGFMLKPDNTIITDSTRLFLRDAYDHTVEAIETVEVYRDFISGLLDINLSRMSNRMNEIVKVLTLISTIFIPLTFIAGVYGMNFRVMPELEWRFGYYSIMVLMLLIAVMMLFYFRKKRWF
ncbi:MAG: magnesium/cobalt transporter CorA [Spirochaetes bacterium]|nr:magnesium/cobalt transporter CorA [Spirochaetota bacterium]